MQGNGSRLPFIFLGVVAIIAAIALLLYLPKLEKPQAPAADDSPTTTQPANGIKIISTSHVEKNR